MIEKSTTRVKRHRARKRQGDELVTIRITAKDKERLAQRGYEIGPGVSLADMVEAYLSDSWSE
jgi:hypothetical protein